MSSSCFPDTSFVGSVDARSSSRRSPCSLSDARRPRAVLDRPPSSTRQASARRVSRRPSLDAVSEMRSGSARVFARLSRPACLLLRPKRSASVMNERHVRQIDGEAITRGRRPRRSPTALPLLARTPTEAGDARCSGCTVHLSPNRSRKATPKASPATHPLATHLGTRRRFKWRRFRRDRLLVLPTR